MRKVVDEKEEMLRGCGSLYGIEGGDECREPGRETGVSERESCFFVRKV